MRKAAFLSIITGLLLLAIGLLFRQMEWPDMFQGIITGPTVLCIGLILLLINQFKKKNMNRLNLFFILLFLPTLLSSQTKNFIDQPHIVIESKVDTVVTPDEIYMSITILEKDTKGKESVEDLEFKMTETLVEMGIDLQKQLKVSEVASNFRRYFLRKQDISKSKSYELLVHEAKTAGKVIYELEGVGISNVNLKSVEFSMKDEIRLDLKRKAVLQGKQHAGLMADAIGQSIGKAILISEGRVNSRPGSLASEVGGVQIKGLYKLANNSSYVMPEIEFEDIKIDYRVSVTFILE